MSSAVSPQAAASARLPGFSQGFGALRYVMVWLVGVPMTAALCTVAILTSLGSTNAAAAHRLARVWARCLLHLIGVRLRVANIDRIEAAGACVLIANHASALDIPVLLAVLPPPVRFLAKASLFRVPFTGWFMSRVGYVPVDRHDPRKARDALRRARQRAGAGVTIMAFPEGTRSPDGSLADFKRGSFHLARDAELPVIPVALRNGWRLMPRGRWQVDPGTIEVIVGEPLAPNASPSAHAFAQMARQRVAALLAGPSPSD